MEGLSDDQIVATAAYCYDEENVTGGALDFRAGVDKDSLYVGSDIPSNDVQQLLGLTHGKPLWQPRGSCATRPNRLVAWPNALQRRVAPFRLVDSTKPGHRKLAFFYLVDPSKPRVRRPRSETRRGDAARAPRPAASSRVASARRRACPPQPGATRPPVPRWRNASASTAPGVCRHPGRGRPAPRRGRLAPRQGRLAPPRCRRGARTLGQDRPRQDPQEDVPCSPRLDLVRQDRPRRRSSRRSTCRRSRRTG